MAVGSTGPPLFGQQLRRLRSAAGLTQEALAERSGVSVDAISALENGRRHRPRPDTVLMLAEGLGLGSRSASV
jgi:transcriptional regulator with XRE-family HTH domain